MAWTLIQPNLAKIMEDRASPTKGHGNQIRLTGGGFTIRRPLLLITRSPIIGLAAFAISMGICTNSPTVVTASFICSREINMYPLSSLHMQKLPSGPRPRAPTSTTLGIAKNPNTVISSNRKHLRGNGWTTQSQVNPAWHRHGLLLPSSSCNVSWDSLIPSR